MSYWCLVDKNLEGHVEEWKIVPRSNEPEGWSGAGGLYENSLILMRQGKRQDVLSISATGATLSEVPMTSSKSTDSRSASREWSKSSVSFSPKNVISGWQTFRFEYAESSEQFDILS